MIHPAVRKSLADAIEKIEGKRAVCNGEIRALEIIVSVYQGEILEFVNAIGVLDSADDVA